MPEPISMSSIAAAWKLLGSLHQKYFEWSVRRQRSKQAEQMKGRAEELMNVINRQILSGAASDDLSLAPVIKEFRNLLKQGLGPKDCDVTEDWIVRSRKPTLKQTQAKNAKPAKKAAVRSDNETHTPRKRNAYPESAPGTQRTTRSRRKAR